MATLLPSVAERCAIKLRSPAELERYSIDIEKISFDRGLETYKTF
jgi:hypothetical protein